MDKVEAARLTGAPIFLTEEELNWLTDFLLDFAHRHDVKRMTVIEKQDYVKAISIATKAGRELYGLPSPES